MEIEAHVHTAVAKSASINSLVSWRFFIFFKHLSAQMHKINGSAVFLRAPRVSCGALEELLQEQRGARVL